MDKSTPQEKHRECKREKQDKQGRESRRLCINIEPEVYAAIIDDHKAFRSYLDECYRKQPELFPEHFSSGYKCVGYCEPSKKMPEMRIRRIRLKANQTSYQVVPCDVMPYMTGYTKDIEKALLLHFKYQVPFDGLVYVFGKDVMYWYRLSQQLGRFNLVTTTAQQADTLPEDLAVDEKHTRWNGKKAYVATTVAEGCVWGAAMSLALDEDQLTESYGVFKQEAQVLEPDYAPTTVNTDGFMSTIKACLALFFSSILMPCFLHGFLKIRNAGKRLSLFHDLSKRVWDAYHQETKAAFIDKLTVLQLWTHHHRHELSQGCLEALNKLCSKAHAYALAYDHPHAHRTSNMCDRLMQKMDRYLFITRYFHGHLQSAELSIRAWALAHNFLPYSARSLQRKQFISPVHKLNRSVYRHNWLENLLVSASLRARVTRTQIPLE